MFVLEAAKNSFSPPCPDYLENQVQFLNVALQQPPSKDVKNIFSVLDPYWQLNMRQPLSF